MALFLFFNIWVIFHSIDNYNFLIDSSVDGHLGSFYVLAIANSPGFSGGSQDKASACNAGGRVRDLCWEDPLEKEMATHSSILAWRIPWTEEPGGLQSTRSQRVGHDWATSHTHTHTRTSHTDEHCSALILSKHVSLQMYAWKWNNGNGSTGALFLLL